MSAQATQSREVYELLTLKEVFGNGTRRFRIPDYQRGYSWEKEQREDLLKDIRDASRHMHRHYTGTIVASEVPNHHDLFDLVDGQQRVTSLILLVAEMRRNAEDKKLSAIGDQSLDAIEKLFIASGKEEGNTQRRLEVGAAQDDLFQELLFFGAPRNREIESKSDKNLCDAVKEYRKWLDGISEEELVQSYNAISKQFGFLFYAPKNDSEIGMMFEVINNRGKPLSELEKIKNYLIYFAERNKKADLKKKVNNSWGRILKLLNEAGFTSNEDENRFLRNCWLVFGSPEKKNSYQVYDRLKEKHPPDQPSNWEVLSSFVAFIERAANTFALLYTRSADASKEEKLWLERISLHFAHASALPLVIAIYDRDISSDERVTLLETIEKLNFRYYVTGIASRNDTGQGHLFSLAHQFHKNENGKHDCDWLHEKLVTFVSSNAGDRAFIENLIIDHDDDYDFYHWHGLKFFLASHEEKLRKDHRQKVDLPKLMAERDPQYPNDFYHKEHIWASKDSSKDAAEDHYDKRRLGNFVLLMETQNIKVSNKPPEEKVELYLNDFELAPNTLMIRDLKPSFDKASNYVAKYGGYSKWVKGRWLMIYKRFLDKREEELLNFALERWRVDGADKLIGSVTIDSSSTQDKVYKAHAKQQG